MPDIDEEKKEKTDYKFHPDSAIKKFLTEISPPKLIGIINAILGTKYATECDVSFGSTEFFKALADLEKNSVRADVVVNIGDETKEERTNKVLIELQSKKDETMGFRMFVYSLNISEINTITKIYEFPKPLTLYTTLDMPEKGIDIACFGVDEFSVTNKNRKLDFSGEDGDVLELRFPFYNVLATDFDDFDGTPLELLKVLYLYRYRKKPSLLKKQDELKYILDNLTDYALNDDNSDKIPICEVLANLLIDMIEICKREEYWEELEIVENLNKTYSDVIREEAEARGEARGEARAEERSKFEIAKNLLGKMDFSEIATVTGLPLSQIEQLRANS